MKFRYIQFENSWILLLSLLLGAPAYGKTNKVGNGGDAVVCHHDGKKSAKLLDFYEYDVDLNEKGKAFEIAQKKIDKIKPAAEKLYNQYTNRLRQIESEIEFKSGVELTDIEDSLHLFKPIEKSCKIEQVAIRKAVSTENEKRFLFRKDIWEQMPPAHQAGLLLHEIIYEHLTKLDEENSIKVRKLNSFIFKKNFESKEFWSLIKELKLPLYP